MVFGESNEVPSHGVKITDADFPEPKGFVQMTQEDKEELVSKLLPSVIAKKIQERIPDGFELTKISFAGEISGQPFGIGVKGSVTVDFTKKPSP